MPTTPRYQIIEDIATALESITTANGYENTLASVQRFLQSGLSVATVPTAVVNFEEERKSQGPTDRVENELRISVDLWVIHDEASVSGSTMQLIDSVCADAEKAIMADPTRSGKARTCEIETITPFRLEEGAPFVGATLRIVCNHMTSISDPYSARN